MAKYTIELRSVCNIYGADTVKSWFTDYELSNYLTSSEIETINNRGVWTKEKLAEKIINHYYMREIGLETPSLFKHYAKVYMTEIMERKLPLIYSSSVDYDMLVNVDYTETYERNITGNAESNSSNTASGLSVNSDTPQGQINKQQVLQGKYASSTGASESESEINDSSSSNTDETYTKSIKGNSGVSATAQKMIEQYRQNIIAIDEDIINELDKLFMGLY